MVNIYTIERKQAVVAQVQEGRSVATVAAATGVHERTIRKWLAIAAKGFPLTTSRPGPKPFFPEVAERHLFDWVVGRQLVGHPVGRPIIIRKAQEIALLGCGRSVGEGWYRRFMERFPTLTARSAQALPLKRNYVVSADLTTLSNTLAKLGIELGLDNSRVFNMDETAFQKQLKSKKVVAVRGSSDVWTNEPSANFHLSIVACGSAAGYVVPPTFIMPGKTVSLRALEGCEVQGAAIMTSRSGFMNAGLFEKWLHFFSNAVPSSVKRPLLFILDDCSSHYTSEVVDTAMKLSIKLVFLSPNATHLLQPLDVAVFAPLKDKILKLIGDLVEDDDEGYCTISKNDAIMVASMAWRGSKIGRNVESGFYACGIFSLSLVKMNVRLNNFTRNGVPRHVQLSTWLQMKTLIEKDILKVPSPPRKGSNTKRKRVTVGGRPLTLAVLQEIEAGKASSATNTRKKPKKNHPSGPDPSDIFESAVV